MPKKINNFSIQPPAGAPFVESNEEMPEELQNTILLHICLQNGGKKTGAAKAPVLSVIYAATRTSPPTGCEPMPETHIPNASTP